MMHEFLRWRSNGLTTLVSLLEIFSLFIIAGLVFTMILSEVLQQSLEPASLDSINGNENGLLRSHETVGNMLGFPCRQEAHWSARYNIL